MSTADTQPKDWFGTGVLATELQENVARKAEVNGRSILLTLWQGKFVATTARCPHAGADLTTGELYRGRVDCPDHGWRFDLSSGRTLFPPDENCRLKRYAVQVRKGEIWVKPNNS